MRGTRPILTNTCSRWRIIALGLYVVIQFLPSCTTAFSLKTSLRIIRRRAAADRSTSYFLSRQQQQHNGARDLDRQQALLLFLKEPNGELQSDETTTKSFYIRKAMYSDLGQVSDIIMSSFYNNDTQKSPWFHFFRLGELNRLQQNFSYEQHSDDSSSEQLHVMFVAATSCTSSSSTKQQKVVAFCDIDARPSQQAQRLDDPPRPYLSDLAVHPQWRRMGIARTLVAHCEELACLQMNQKELYIRVEQNNTAAVNMYESMDYQAQDHEYFGVKDTTMLLHKKLTNVVTYLGGANWKNRTQDEQVVLDYVQ